MYYHTLFVSKEKLPQNESFYLEIYRRTIEPDEVEILASGTSDGIPADPDIDCGDDRLTEVSGIIRDYDIFDAGNNPSKTQTFANVYTDRAESACDDMQRGSCYVCAGYILLGVPTPDFPVWEIIPGESGIEKTSSKALKFKAGAPEGQFHWVLVSAHY